MQQQRGLARGGRAFERRRRDSDDHPPPPKSSSTSRGSEGAGDRVELVARLDQARSGRRVEVGAQRDHQHVASNGPASVSTRRPRRVDGPDRGLDEPDPRLDESRYACRTRRRRVRPNITSSLEKPNMNPSVWSISTSRRHRRVRRQSGGELQAAEAGTAIRLSTSSGSVADAGRGSGWLGDDPDVRLGLGRAAEDFLGLLVADGAGDTRPRPASSSQAWRPGAWR